MGWAEPENAVAGSAVDGLFLAVIESVKVWSRVGLLVGD